jgi:actin related protein 2/3 complex subunit 2
MYHLSTPDPEDRNIVRLSMQMRCFQTQLAKYGAIVLLQREYGKLLLAQPEPGYDVTLEFHQDQVPAQERGRIKILLNKCFRIIFKA